MVARSALILRYAHIVCLVVTSIGTKLPRCTPTCSSVSRRIPDSRCDSFKYNYQPRKCRWIVITCGAQRGSATCQKPTWCGPWHRLLAAVLIRIGRRAYGVTSVLWVSRAPRGSDRRHRSWYVNFTLPDNNHSTLISGPMFALFTLRILFSTLLGILKVI